MIGRRLALLGSYGVPLVRCLLLIMVFLVLLYVLQVRFYVASLRVGCAWAFTANNPCVDGCCTVFWAPSGVEYTRIDQVRPRTLHRFVLPGVPGTAVRLS